MANRSTITKVDLRKVAVWWLLLLVGSLVLACTAEPATSVPSARKEVAPAAKSAWQEDWDRTLAAAKKEGSLMIYHTGGTDVRAALNSAFRQKYGIGVDYLYGTVTELLTKIFTERRAGLYLSDLIMAGSLLPMALKPAGALAPIKPLLVVPEVLDKNAWFDSELPFVDKEGEYVVLHGNVISRYVVVNTDLVKPDEVKGYRDLLNPKWKGKIIILDPTQPGPASTVFLMTAMVILDPDYHVQLAKQEPVVTRDRRLQVESLAKGKYAIALASSPDMLSEFIKAGAPIRSIAPQEGAFVASGGSGTIAFSDRAPNPNAAKVFANWLLTREGLTVWSKASLGQSARRDVPVDFLDPEARREPGAKYFNHCKEEILSKDGEAIELARKIYGPLMK